MLEPHEINQFIPKRAVKYSVCTLVSNRTEYAGMVESYIQAGFTHDICEFLYVDNSEGNKYDAYTGLNKLMDQASGQYLILSHQDVELIYDREPNLKQKIEEITRLDAKWAVLANAGGADVKRLYRRISHPHDTFNQGPLPQKVVSVDENFILLKKEAGLRFSYDLEGFHLYGTDICLVAEQKGYTCYVIDFHLLHKSTGNVNESFFKARQAMMQKYAQTLSPRYIRTTCTHMFISKSPLLNYLMNKPFMITVAKFLKKAELRAKGIKY